MLKKEEGARMANLIFSTELRYVAIFLSFFFLFHGFSTNVDKFEIVRTQRVPVRKWFVGSNTKGLGDWLRCRTVNNECKIENSSMLEAGIFNSIQIHSLHQFDAISN